MTSPEPVAHISFAAWSGLERIELDTEYPCAAFRMTKDEVHVKVNGVWTMLIPPMKK